MDLAKRISVLLLAVSAFAAAQSPRQALKNPVQVPAAVSSPVLGSIANAYLDRGVLVVHIMPLIQAPFGSPKIDEVKLCSDSKETIVQDLVTPLVHSNVTLAFGETGPTGCRSLLTIHPWDDGVVRTMTPLTPIQGNKKTRKAIQNLIDKSK